MKNLIDDQAKQLKTFIMKSFKDSGKKHLLITGSKKIGKSTILNEILENEESVGGIITYTVTDEKVPPTFVILKDLNDSSINGIIATRNVLCNALISDINTFNILGVDILNRYCHSNKKIIVIDEIGFLENDAFSYQNEILKCFEKKRVISVIRKENTPFISKLIQRKDIFLIDIDDFI